MQESCQTCGLCLRPSLEEGRAAASHDRAGDLQREADVIVAATIPQAFSRVSEYYSKERTGLRKTGSRFQARQPVFRLHGEIGRFRFPPLGQMTILLAGEASKSSRLRFCNFPGLLVYIGPFCVHFLDDKGPWNEADFAHCRACPCCCHQEVPSRTQKRRASPHGRGARHHKLSAPVPWQF